MKRTLICSAAGAAAVALAASSAMAQLYSPPLVFSFETLYNSMGTPNTGTYPDGFTNNSTPSEPTTISQSTIGATQGSYSMEFQQAAAAYFTGALLSATVLPIPEIINDPNTVALSLDVTIPSTGNFTGTFARMGISEYGTSVSSGGPGQAQTNAASEVNIDLAPGTYQFTIPLISISNPSTGAMNVPFSNVFGTGETQYTPTGFQFYINKSTDSALTVYIDNVQAIGPATVGTWANTGGGSWSTLGNWTGGIPTLALDTASLTGAIMANSTITLDGNYSVGTLIFDNSSYDYTVAAGTGGTLTLDVGGSDQPAPAVSPNHTAYIIDSGGTHTISAPVDFNTGTTISVTNSGDALDLTGPISGLGDLKISGNGTVDISGSNSYLGGTTVNSGTLVIGSSESLPSSNSVLTINGGKARLATGIGATTLQSLTIASGGSFDITNNHILLNDAGGSIDSTIRAYLAAGYNGGGWNGTSGGVIMTSAPITIGAGTYSIGYADGADNVVAGLSSGQLEVAYTLAGDANLDGKVDSADFGILADNYGASAAVWDEGDFNYDGKVDSADFGILAVNYGQSAGSNADVVTAADWSALDAFASANDVTLTAVPEPASLGILALSGLAILSRRTRKTNRR